MCTAESIFLQSSIDWQWIIIDGASDDGTKKWLQNIVRSRSNVIFISEPDQGIYYAWNKSLPLVQGEWVLFLGAGDKLKTSITIETCIQQLKEVPIKINLAYGSVEYIDNIQEKAGKLSLEKWEGINGKWVWCRPVLPNHQGVFHRTDMLTKRGGFDTTYKIASDTAMILPELMKNGAKELPVCITLRFKNGTSLAHKNRAKVLLEVMNINRSVGLGSKRIVYQYTAFLYHMIKSLLTSIIQ